MTVWRVSNAVVTETSVLCVLRRKTVFVYMWQMLISLENSESNYCVVHLGLYIDTAAVIVMHYAHTRPRKDII